MSRRVMLEEGTEYTRYSLRYVKVDTMRRVRMLNAQHPEVFPTIENTMNKCLEVGVSAIEKHFNQAQQANGATPNAGSTDQDRESPAVT